MSKIKFYFYLILGIFIVFLFFAKLDIRYSLRAENELDIKQTSQQVNEANQAKIAPVDKTVKVEIVANSTYGSLMQEAEVPTGEISQIYQAASQVYDLAKIKQGNFLL